MREKLIHNIEEYNSFIEELNIKLLETTIPFQKRNIECIIKIYERQIQKCRSKLNSLKSRVGHNLDRDEFISALYNFITKVVNQMISKESTSSLLKFYEKEDIAQMAFIKAFQPTKDGRDIYQRYLDQPYKDWYKSLGGIATVHTIQDLMKKKDYRCLQNTFLMDNIDIIKFDFTPNISYINEFIDRYGDEKILKSNILIRDIVKELINGYSMTSVCKKFKVTKKNVIETFNYFNFKDYLINN